MPSVIECSIKISSVKTRRKPIICSGRINKLNDEDVVPHLNYYFTPIIIITLSTYFIADIFFGVYEMGVDTLFLCFLEVSINIAITVRRSHLICKSTNHLNY